MNKFHYITLLLLLVPLFCIGQEEAVFSPISNSTNRPFTYELFASASYSFTNIAETENRWYSMRNSINDYTTTEFGINAHLFRMNSLLLYSFGAGYSRTSLFFTKDNSSSNGVYTHWTYANIAIGLNKYLLLGSDMRLFLSSSPINNNGFNYVWFNNDYFNKFSCSIYLEGRLLLSHLYVGVRVGAYPIPMFNANKIAYYTLRRTNVERFYFAVSTGFRIFTQQNHLK